MVSTFFTTVADDRRETFEFFSEVQRDGDFIKIWEKGRKKIRCAWLAASMVMWLTSSLSLVTEKPSGFVRKKRFGRVLSWVKTRSYDRGGFLEIGCSSRGKSSSFFRAWGRDGCWWVEFLATLGRTTTMVVQKQCRPEERQGSTPTRVDLSGAVCSRCANCACR